ncbi:MAG: LLM class flavin-dependent oxidoreductase, partial [Dehalococcoidia bacterium]
MHFDAFNLFQHPEAARRPEMYREELENELQQIEYAEKLGYYGIWLAEHHFSEYGMASDALLMAANVANRTERVRIGIAVSVLPFHNPIRLAEQAATVDALSNGRLDHGVGRGYQPYEFKGFGIDMEESRERFDECLDVMIEAWTKERFSYHGKHWDFTDVSVYPKPTQKPFPRTFLACSSQESVAGAARRALPILTGAVFWPIQKTKDVLGQYVDSLKKEGRSLAEIQRLISDSGFLQFVYVADTNEKAKEEPRECLLNYLSILSKYTLPPFAAPPPGGFKDIAHEQFG